MMRRARISVRPNIARPGGRGLSGAQEGQHGPVATVVDTTPAARTEVKEPDSAAVKDPGQPVEQSAERTAGLNASQDTTPEKNYFLQSRGEESQNGGTLNGRPLTATTPQRRKRLSAMPNLGKPRATPVPRTPKSPLPQAAAPPTPTESATPVPDGQTAEGSGAGQGVVSPAVAALGVQAKPQDQTGPIPAVAVLEDRAASQDQSGPVSPVAPTTSCWELTAQKSKKRTRKSSDLPNVAPESKASGSQPVQSEPVSGCGNLSPGNASSQTGPSIQPYPFKLMGGPEDRLRIAKARKLKEMMRLEKRKERRKGKHHDFDYSAPLDHGKMTMRDLIYYLPDTNPMKSALMEEQNPDEQFTPQLPSNGLPVNKMEMAEEEEDVGDDDDPMEDEELLVPKVKVAEDGSLIIDEESLTVRVMRAKGPSIVEGNDPVFERGSTTTYSSFRKLNHTKPWSEKETDMFFLAISMVGSDFSMICQLFPHRTRTEVKNKFKKEERCSSWRIDKAFREKRPFDLEFFSSLLELVLAAGKKKKNKSKPKGASGEKRKRKPRGKKVSVKGTNESQATDDVEQDDDVAEGDLETAEKENKDCTNVAEAKGAAEGTRKKRKLTKKSEGEELDEEEPGSTQKQEDGVKAKRRKKMANGKKASVKGANEHQATDVELDGDACEGGLETAEKENEDYTEIAKATSASKVLRKKRKHAKKSEGEEQEEEEEPDSTKKQDDGAKSKRRKKMPKGLKASVKAAGEDQPSPDGELDNDVADTPNTARVVRKKRKRAKKGEEEEPDLNTDGAILVDVAEDEVTNGQSDADEAGGSETLGKAVETKQDKPARTSRTKAKPNLVPGRRAKNIPDSEEKTLDSSRREEEDGRGDGDCLSTVCYSSDIPEGKSVIEGSAASPCPSPEGDLPGVRGVSPAEGQKLMGSTSFEGEETPPSSLPPPEATSPKGCGKQSEVEPWPIGGSYQEEEEEWGSPTCTEEQSPEQVLVPLGLHSLELLPDELEMPAGVPDAPGPGLCADAPGSEPRCEGEQSVELSEHHLNLLVDVMESLSPDIVAGMHAGENDDEVARTLLTLSNPDLQLLSVATPIPEMVSAPEPSHQPPVDDQEPKQEQADQSPCSSDSPQAVIYDLPNALVPVNEAETLPTEESGILEEDEIAAATKNGTLNSETQSSVPLGRRSRFPKPKPNLGRATRAPRTPLRQTAVPPGPGQVTCAGPPTVDMELPTEEKSSDPNHTRDEESASVVMEREDSGSQELQRPAVLSTQNESPCSDSSVQSTPLGRRSRLPKPRPNLSLATRAPRPAPSQIPAVPQQVDDGGHAPLEESNTQTPVQEALTCSHAGRSVEDIAQQAPTEGPAEHLNTEKETPAVETGTTSSSLGTLLGSPQPYPGPSFTELVPGTGGEGAIQGPQASEGLYHGTTLNQKELVLEDEEGASLRVDTSGPAAGSEGTSICVDGDISALDNTECLEGLAWAAVAEEEEEEPTFILTLFEIPHSELGEYQTGPEVPGQATEDPFRPLTFVDPQSEPQPAVSEPQNCESLSVEAAEAESGCGSVTHLVVSDALIPVCEGQEEGAAQYWTGLQEQHPHTDLPQAAGETPLTTAMKDAVGVAGVCEADCGSEIAALLVESHDPVEAGTDGTSERDTPSRETRKPPPRTRRAKLQVKPCVTQRKLRGSVRDEQEAEQPGPAYTQPCPAHTQPCPTHTHPDPAHKQPDSTHMSSNPTHTSPLTHPPTTTYSDTQQEEPTAAPDLPAVGELPQGIVGRSVLPREGRGAAAGAESKENNGGGEEPLLVNHNTQNSCESLSVEAAEAESGCGSVSHLVLSNALIPVCEGQEEGAAQDWTGLQEQHPHTDLPQAAGETPLTTAMKDDTGSDRTRLRLPREKTKLPARTRRTKLQVKPCVTQRKLRGSVRDEPEAEQPGPSHTQSSPTHTSPQTHPDIQQEAPAPPPELPAMGQLPQEILGHSDLQQEKVGVTARADNVEGRGSGEEPLLDCPSTQNTCESLSVEAAEAESGCGSVTHLVLSDALIPVCEGQEEGAAQDWTGLQEQHPHTDLPQAAGETPLTTAMKDNAEGVAVLCEEDHSSLTVAPLVESQDLVVAGTDNSSERDALSREHRKPPARTRRAKLQLKPCVTQRKLRGSVRDEQEAEQPGPSHTQPSPTHISPQTHPPTAPHTDTQQEEPTVASELPAVGELPQGIVGHSELPQEEVGIAAGADMESGGGGEGHSTPPPTSSTLTRPGRAPRGFLAFLSGSSGTSLSSRASRPISHKPSVNTSRTGRKRTARDTVMETSIQGSLCNSPPTEVRSSASPSEPSAEVANSQVSASAEGAFLCARPLEAKEEPTNVSEFYFEDIFTEVQESD